MLRVGGMGGRGMHEQIEVRPRGPQKKIRIMRRKRCCGSTPRGREGGRARGLSIMKSSNLSRSPVAKVYPEGDATGLQGMVFSLRVDWRGGDLRGPCATRAMARLGPSGDVLFGRRVGAGGGSHQRSLRRTIRIAQAKGDLGTSVAHARGSHRCGRVHGLGDAD